MTEPVTDPGQRPDESAPVVDRLGRTLERLVSEAEQLVQRLGRGGATGREQPEFRMQGLAWATVELDRAAAELGGLASPVPLAFRDAPRDEFLGAHARVAVVTAGPWMVLVEPATEGRLAAYLARHGEGLAAVYVSVDQAPATEEPGVTEEEPGLTEEPGVTEEEPGLTEEPSPAGESRPVDHPTAADEPRAASTSSRPRAAPTAGVRLGRTGAEAAGSLVPGPLGPARVLAGGRDGPWLIQLLPEQRTGAPGRRGA